MNHLEQYQELLQAYFSSNTEIHQNCKKNRDNARKHRFNQNQHKNTRNSKNETYKSSIMRYYRPILAIFHIKIKKKQEYTKNQRISRKSRAGQKSTIPIQKQCKQPQILSIRIHQKHTKMRPKINQFLSQNRFLAKCLLFIGNPRKTHFVRENH